MYICSGNICHANIRISIRMHVYIDVYAYILICVYVYHLFVCVHECIYIYICIHTVTLNTHIGAYMGIHGMTFVLGMCAYSSQSRPVNGSGGGGVGTLLALAGNENDESGCKMLSEQEASAAVFSRQPLDRHYPSTDPQVLLSLLHGSHFSSILGLTLLGAA